MLSTIQYIALVQGIFLVFVLLKNNRKYKRPLIWLLLGCLISIILFVIGDDENNLWWPETDIFFLDSSLFITFFFLFFKYKESGQSHFRTFDLIFFLPNFLYLGIELTELVWTEDLFILEILELVAEITFLAYLVIILAFAMKMRNRDWIVYFVVPIVIISSLNYVANIRELVSGQELMILGYDDYNFYYLLVLAFLFFFISFALIDRPGWVLPRIKNGGYSKSKLKTAQIEDYKQKLIGIMEDEAYFLNQKLSIHDVSRRLNIPRRYISEVLNVHMKISFQEFVNSYRIAEFINRLNEPKYDHYTLFGLASEVGFSSKSTFNSAFKKAKGKTPLAYKNSLPLTIESGTK